MQYGRSNAGEQCPVNVEFVSANPTGPLHVGHGRQAALGDAISSLLAATGWRVTREFYYNDAGAQITNLALSVQARVRELGGVDVAFPEGGYHGEYIRDLAQRYIDEHSSRPERRRPRRGAAVRRARAAQGAGSRSAGVRRQVRRLLPRVVALRRRPRRRHDPAARRGGAHVREGRRALAARRPTSATTRIASCAAARRRAASRPTSCPTSRTTSRSGSAGSSARSTCRAPTTTAR